MDTLVEVPLIPVVGEDASVLAWLRDNVAPTIPDVVPRSVTLGFERDGRLVGAAVFKDYCESGDVELAYCYLHPDCAHLGAYFRASVFGYVFQQLRCLRVSTGARADDVAAIQTITDYGFRLEARMREAADADTDYLLFGMLAKECTHLPTVH